MACLQPPDIAITSQEGGLQHMIGKWHSASCRISARSKAADHFFGICGCCAGYFNHGSDASRMAIWRIAP
jgi:hypothetical protein